MTSPTTNNEPDWLKAEIFEDILKTNVKNYKEIKDFRVSPASAPGENYSSSVLRIEIDCTLQDGSDQTKSFFLKIPIENETMKKINEEADTIEVENDTLHKVFPELQAMYRDAGVDVKFGAQSYRLPIPDDIEYILMEDLKAKGCRNADRLEGLNMEHMKSVLHKLALLHAASATRVETKGDYDQKYKRGKFVETVREMTSDFFQSVGKILLKTVATYEGHEAYIEGLEKYHNGVIEEMWLKSASQPDEFKVLNHGDCWINNLMFQYDVQDRLNDIYFVDLQIPHYGSNAEDLWYLIISSAQCDIKLNEFDYFIQYYHENLCKYLEVLKYPKTMPTIEELHKNLRDYVVYAYTTMISAMGAALLQKTDQSKFENFFSDSEDANRFQTLMFTNERYRKHAELILPWFHKRGVF